MITAGAMVRRLWRKFGLVSTAALVSGSMLWMYAQERPNFRVKVDMVVLSFTVTDSKGRYVNGLKPKDFKILEDGIQQKVNTFAEGNKPPVVVKEDGTFTRPNDGICDSEVVHTRWEQKGWLSKDAKSLSVHPANE